MCCVFVTAFVFVVAFRAFFFFFALSSVVILIKCVLFVWLLVCYIDNVLIDIVDVIFFFLGLSDGNSVVQNAALFALGQYSEFLQVTQLILVIMLNNNN